MPNLHPKAAAVTLVGRVRMGVQQQAVMTNIGVSTSVNEDVGRSKRERQPPKNPAGAQSELKAKPMMMVERVTSATAAQIDAWVDDNTGDVTQMRAMMKPPLKVLAHSLKP
jgi:hypothetical protein